MARDLSIRIAVGAPTERRSTVWKVWSCRDEVYAAHTSMAAIQKLSFHSSRKCRLAFLEKLPRPHPEEDRVINRWERAALDPAKPDVAVKVLTVYFPECYLGKGWLPPSKKTAWLSPPEPGTLTAFQLVYTLEPETAIQTCAHNMGYTLLSYHVLPGQEAVFIWTWTESYPEGDLIVPSRDGVEPDMVFPIKAPPDATRELHFTIFRQPEEMQSIECLGYKVPAGEASRRFPGASVFARTAISHSSEILKGLAQDPADQPTAQCADIAAVDHYRSHS